MQAEAYLKRLPVVMLLAWMLASIIEVGLSIASCQGRLIYTLDDPYIHLAVAENILRGVYGINLSEHSSPSSSIAFPFVLAGAEALGLGSWAPLAVNATAAALAVFGSGVILRSIVFAKVANASGVAFAYLIGAMFLLVLNAVALPMTGLEHMLHVLMVVLNIIGLYRVATGQRAPWLAAAIVALPLCRFEGIAMAGAMILSLWLLGRRRQAVIASLAIVAALAAYFAFMHALGLPLMPSSVLLKSHLTSAATGASESSGLVPALLGNLKLIGRTLEAKSFVLLLLLIAVRWVIELRTQRRPAHLAVGFVAAATLAAHLAAGSYGWFGRYEVYAGAAGTLAVLVLYSSEITVGRFVVLARAAAFLVIAVVAVSYVEPTLKTPAASRNVYQQHYQMHRFLTEYWRRPVAVNDLGWVSYRNDAYVLDLFGLGSEEVRELRSTGKLDAAAIDRLVREKHVDFAMIYDEWFPGSVPSEWRKVAVLHTSRVSSASGNVAFYSTQPEGRSELMAALAAFRGTLPPGATLSLISSPP